MFSSSEIHDDDLKASHSRFATRPSLFKFLLLAADLVAKQITCAPECMLKE
jgi:hypothetical protein